MNPSEICEKAIEVLDEKGWCQGAIQDENGSVCAVGALGYAANLNYGITTITGTNYVMRSLPEPILEVMDDLAPLKAPRWWELGSSIHWTNDDEETTVEDIKDLFMKAAKHFRNEGQ